MRLNLYSVQGRLIRADLIQYWKIFNEKSHIVPTDLFQLAPQTGTRGHCFKIFLPTIHTDVRKRFFNVRCISTWNSLPQHVVTARSVSCFKKLLAEAGASFCIGLVGPKPYQCSFEPYQYSSGPYQCFVLTFLSQ